MKISLGTLFNLGATILNLVVYRYSSEPWELNMFCAGASFAIFSLCVIDDYSNYRNS